MGEVQRRTDIGYLVFSSWVRFREERTLDV